MVDSSHSLSPGGRLISPGFHLSFRNSQRKFWTIAVILFFIVGLPATHALDFDATSLHGPAALATGWLVHDGDDLAFAKPGFDDSDWKPFNAETDSLHDLLPGARPQFIWYRLHLKVSPKDRDLALLENSISGVSELFCNGTLLLRVGQVSPQVSLVPSAFMIARIPAEQVRTGFIVFALRLPVAAMGFSDLRPGLYSENLILGDEGALRDRMWMTIIGGSARSGGHALLWLEDLASVCMLIGGVLLYSTQRDHAEYLWLSLWALAFLVQAPLDLYSLFHNYPIDWFDLQSALMALFGPYTLARMYCAFVGHRVGWKLHLYIGFTCLAQCILQMRLSLGSMAALEGPVLISPLIILVLIVLPIIVFRGVRRSNFAEVVLILPLALIGLWLLVNQVPLALTEIPALRDRAWSIFFLTAGKQFGPFYVPSYSVTDIVSKFSLALIILVRTNRMSRQQALLEGQIDAAREIQQVIVPEQIGQVPGFVIESVYEPAQQVGGDFFQILPVSENGLLLVVGDVAGKGLPAAMLVSLLVGTIRTAAEESPSPSNLLSKLNERLVGRTHGGFSTALVARFSTDGEVTIANAGHLSPYLDGEEIELPGALPLGLVSGVEYEAREFHLKQGSRITFYSDGVIEAQNKKHELFGFERARLISTQSAESIAYSAKHFGQEDDITVISITRQEVL